jgi:hypothetical protein
VASLSFEALRPSEGAPRLSDLWPSALRHLKKFPVLQNINGPTSILPAKDTDPRFGPASGSSLERKEPRAARLPHFRHARTGRFTPKAAPHLRPDYPALRDDLKPPDPARSLQPRDALEVALRVTQGPRNSVGSAALILSGYHRVIPCECVHFQLMWGDSTCRSSSPDALRNHADENERNNFLTLAGTLLDEAIVQMTAGVSQYGQPVPVKAYVAN